MRTFRRQNFRSFFAGLTILSVTFTQACPAWAYGCLAFGCSCRQTINEATSPIRTNPPSGIRAIRSFMGYAPFLSVSGVNHVPKRIKPEVATNATKNIGRLSLPVTSCPINKIETTNSADRPKIAAKYFRFASLSLTTQAYHTLSWRATE